MEQYGIEWVHKGTHEKHKSVNEFKRDMLVKEVEELTEEKSDLEHKVSAYKNAENYALLTAQKVSDNEDWKIPEPPPLMSARTYKSKYIEPFVKRLIEFIQTLARRCFRAEKEAEQAKEKMSVLSKENQRLESRVWDLSLENRRLKAEVKNFDKIKKYLGIDKIQEILKHANKKSNQLNR